MLAMRHLRSALWLAPILGLVACTPQSVPAPPPDGWVAYPTPPPRACAWARAQGSTRDWRVRLADGRLVIERNDDVAPDPTLPVFQIPAAEKKAWTCPECVMRVEDGILVGFNGGEFGGRLWWTDGSGGNAYAVPHIGRCRDIADTGRPSPPFRAENVKALVRSGGRIFVMTGLTFFGPHQGEFSLVERSQGKWQTCLARNLEGEPIAQTADGADSWFVMTDIGLVHVDVHGAMRKFGSFSLIEEGFYPSSMVKLADGTLYTAARHFVARLTPEPYGVYREELFVPKERPEFDYVSWIDAPDSRHECKGKKPTDRQL